MTVFNRSLAQISFISKLVYFLKFVRAAKIFSFSNIGLFALLALQRIWV